MRIFVTFLLLISSGGSFAVGPLDGEASIDWWGNELSGNPFDNTLDAGTLSLRAEGWWNKKWGIRGGLYLTDIDAPQFDDPRRISLDVKRRFLSPTDNTFVAAGLGWENLGLESGETSNGIRLSLEGRFGLGGIATLYGESIWMPSFSSVNGLSNVSGIEFETGVVFDPFPFLSVRAGYRRFRLNYDLNNDSGNSISQGLLIGAGIHW